MTGIEENPRPRFRIGDIVSVAGYDGEWRIDSYTLSIHYTEGGASVEKIYYCIQDNGKSESYIVAYPEDMRFLYRVEKDRKITRPSDEIDLLLDAYNDYMTLYQAFGDERYLTEAKRCIQRLKNITACAG